MRQRRDLLYNVPDETDLRSDVDRRLDALRASNGGLQGVDLIRAFTAREFPGRTALTSSFGAESAVLLHMAATVDRSIPVLFLDTGKLFPETLAYRDALVGRLGLTAVRTVTPAAYEIDALDPDGALHARDPDQCCFLRKVAPLDRVIGAYAVWITGRKAHHGAGRARLSTIEAEDGRIKVNPLLHWRPADIDAYMQAHGLPPHPLVTKGFLSIGCAPCTDRTGAGEDPRAGRWPKCGKTECGIHGRREAVASPGGAS